MSERDKRKLTGTVWLIVCAVMAITYLWVTQ